MITIEYILNLIGVITIFAIVLVLVPDIIKELKKLKRKASGLKKLPKAMRWSEKKRTYLMLSKPIWYLIITLLLVVGITLILIVFLGLKSQYWSSQHNLRISALEAEIMELKQLIIVNCRG